MAKMPVIRETPEGTPEQRKREREKQRARDIEERTVRIPGKEREEREERPEKIVTPEEVKTRLLEELVSFKPPEGATPGPLTAKGEPVWYEKDGVKFYTPDSTMWQKGFRTSDEYIKPQRQVFTDPGTGKKRVVWTGGEARDSGFLSPGVDAEQLSRNIRGQAERTIPDFRDLSQKEQFKALVDAGLIETGSVMIPGRGRNWSYYPGSEFVRVAALKSRLPLPAYTQRLMAKFKRENVQLGDGTWIDKEAFGDLSVPLQRIAKRKGYDALVSEINKLHAETMVQDVKLQQLTEMQQQYADFKQGHIIIGNEAMAIDVWNNLSPDLQHVALNQGFDAMEREVMSAKKLLSPYQVNGNKYDIAEAMLTRDKDITNAVELLFSSSDVEETRHRILPKLTIGTGISKKELETLAKTDPRLVQLRMQAAGQYAYYEDVPAPLLAAAGITAATPIPGDELVTLGIIALVLGTAGAVKLIRDYKENQGRLPTMADVQAPTLPQPRGVVPLPTGTKLIPPQVDVKLPAHKRDMIVLGLPPMIPPKVQGIEGYFPKYRQPVVTIPGIGDLPRELDYAERVWHGRPDAKDAYMASQELKKADEALTEKVKVVTKTIGPEDLGVSEKEFAEMVRARVYGREKPQVDWAKVINDMVRAANARASADIVRRAKENERRIQLMVEVALARLRELSAGVVDDAVSAAGAYRQVRSIPFGPLRQAVLAGQIAFAEAVSQGRSETKAKSSAIAKAQTTLATALKTAVATETETQTMTNALTKTLEETLTQTAPATMTVETAIPRTAVQTATAAQTTTLISTTTTIPRPKPGASEKAKRDYIRKVGGAIAWRQGTLDRKPVYHVLTAPYRSEADHMVVVGRKPKGAGVASGRFSAYKTIKRLHGQVPKAPISLDLGAMDVRIEPRGRKGVRIFFSPDPDLETTGDIMIGRDARLSRPAPRISGGGGIRITPKTPKLRR